MNMEERIARTAQRRRVAEWRRQQSLAASRRYARARRAARRGRAAASIAPYSGAAAAPCSGAAAAASSAGASVPSGEMDAASRRACAAGIARLVAMLPYLPDTDTPPRDPNDPWQQPLWRASTGEAGICESSNKLVVDSFDQAMPDFTEEVVPDFTEEVAPDSIEEVAPDSIEGVAVVEEWDEFEAAIMEAQHNGVSEDILATYENMLLRLGGRTWHDIPRRWNGLSPTSGVGWADSKKG